MLPSHAIGNFLFPTYEVVITSLSYSSALMSERIKCSIPLVDNHIRVPFVFILVHLAKQCIQDVCYFAEHRSPFLGVLMLLFPRIKHSN